MRSGSATKISRLLYSLTARFSVVCTSIEGTVDWIPEKNEVVKGCDWADFDKVMQGVPGRAPGERGAGLSGIAARLLMMGSRGEFVKWSGPQA